MSDETNACGFLTNFLAIIGTTTIMVAIGLIIGASTDNIRIEQVDFRGASTIIIAFPKSGYSY